MTDPVEVRAADVREWLERMVVQWYSNGSGSDANRLRSYAAAIARLEEREKRYREALEPFARAADHYEHKTFHRPAERWGFGHEARCDQRDTALLADNTIGLPDSLTIGTLRAARAALRAGQEGVKER